MEISQECIDYIRAKKLEITETNNDNYKRNRLIKELSHYLLSIGYLFKSTSDDGISYGYVIHPKYVVDWIKYPFANTYPDWAIFYTSNL